jgi:tRNA(Ile)-lysidine synthase
LSGGIDSSVLLSLCLKNGLNISIAHCNFQLRGKDSEDDALWIKKLAEYKKLECHIKKFDIPIYAKNRKTSIQMAARKLRYDWFNELSIKYNYEVILVAHHADDVLETFMINPMRGSGLKGLVGIPQIRGKIIRPLLPFTRTEILNYANHKGLKDIISMMSYKNYFIIIFY